ncbi:MAG: GNAT family N-acetyltransferase [Mesorhizobium sp.]|nr:GNAT family N-acetyltransferase [Mesorhizobium sp.]
MIPTLETRRLVLRAMKAEDFEPFAAFYASEAARFVGGPEDRVATWRRMAAYAGSWTLRGYGKFVVEDRQTGRPAGMAGPWYPEDWPEPELSWTFLPEFQGRGYATEAAARSLAYAYDELGWTTAISAIAPGNDRSARLAERLGARLEGTADVASFGALEIWRHLPPAEFRAHFARMQ